MKSGRQRCASRCTRRAGFFRFEAALDQANDNALPQRLGLDSLVGFAAHALVALVLLRTDAMLAEHPSTDVVRAQTRERVRRFRERERAEAEA